MFEKHETRNSKLFYSIKGFAIFLFFFILSKLTSFVTKLHALSFSENDGSIFAGLPTYAVYLTASAAILFIFNSASIAFSIFDKDELCNFLERDDKKLSFSKEIVDILRTPHLICEIISTLVCVALTALIGGFSEIGGIFFESAHRSGWVPTVILLPPCFILAVLAKYEARRYWYKLDRENDLEKVTSPFRFSIRLIILFILYPSCFPLSPLLVFMIITFISIIISLTNALTVIGTLIAIVVIPSLIIGINLLRGLSKRRKFFKKLNGIAESEGYIISDLKNQYKSFIKSSCHCTFDLIYGKEVYNCLIISTLRRKTPLVFTSETSAYFEHRLGTKEHHISLNHNIDFFLYGNGKKILIIHPSPKDVFVTDDIKSRRLSSADKIWDYTVHDDVSFLGAAGRKCLDKSSPREY